MYRRCRKIVLVLVLAILLAVSAGAQTVSQEQLETQALSLLELLDRGRNEDAWLSMSPLFQASNSRALWLSQQQALRLAYGVLFSRQSHRISYRQSYNLSPDGPHVILQYKSSFQYKASTIETVVFDCRAAPECSIREYIIR